MRELTNARRWRWVIGALGLRLHARPRLWAFEESAAGLSPCIPILRSGQAKARLSAGTNAGGVSMRSTPPRRFAPPLVCLIWTCKGDAFDLQHRLGSPCHPQGFEAR